MNKKVTFPLRLNQDFHNNLMDAVHKRKKNDKTLSMHQYCLDAIQEKINKDLGEAKVSSK